MRRRASSCRGTNIGVRCRLENWEFVGGEVFLPQRHKLGQELAWFEGMAKLGGEVVKLLWRSAAWGLAMPSIGLTARHNLRHEKAPPLLAEIRTHILEMSKTVLPKSAAGQACSYTMAIWKRLIRFLDYPEPEVEEQPRGKFSCAAWPWVEKTGIHIGSEQAGPRVAAILSVIESCRRLKIPVRNYLADILPGLANASIQRIADITPAAWAAKHP